MTDLFRVLFGKSRVRRLIVGWVPPLHSAEIDSEPLSQKEGGSRMSLL